MAIENVQQIAEVMSHTLIAAGLLIGSVRSAPQSASHCSAASSSRAPRGSRNSRRC